MIHFLLLHRILEIRQILDRQKRWFVSWTIDVVSSFTRTESKMVSKEKLFKPDQRYTHIIINDIATPSWPWYCMRWPWDDGTVIWARPQDDRRVIGKGRWSVGERVDDGTFSKGFLGSAHDRCMWKSSSSYGNDSNDSRHSKMKRILWVTEEFMSDLSNTHWIRI